MVSLKSYLEDTFNSAIQCSFPEIEPFDTIQTFYKSRYTDHDISTSVAHRIGHFIGKCNDTNSVAQTLLNTIHWDSSFINTDCQKSINNGFINLHISSKYLCTYLQSITPIKNTFEKSAEDSTIAIALGKMERIMQHAQRLESYDSAEAITKYIAQITPVERELLILAIHLDFSDLSSGKDYFLKKIAQSFEVLYQRIPVFTKNAEITSGRLLLVKKLISVFGMHRM